MRRLASLLIAVAALAFAAPAVAQTNVVPHIFATQSGQVPASQLDDNFTYVLQAGHLNGNVQIPQFNSGTNASSLTYWSGDGTWKSLPVVMGFVMNGASTGTNTGPVLIASRAGTVVKCKVVTKASDGSTPLTFRIRQNGTDIFSADPTIPAGTAANTVTTITALTSSPLSVAADDLFTIDVTSGTSSWQVTIQLE